MSANVLTAAAGRKTEPPTANLPNIHYLNKVCRGVSSWREYRVDTAADTVTVISRCGKYQHSNTVTVDEGRKDYRRAVEMGYSPW